MQKREFTVRTLICLILSIIFILPIYWTVVTSLKEKTEIYAVPPTLFPKDGIIDNYYKIFTLGNGIYARYFVNSIVITSPCTAAI